MMTPTIDWSLLAICVAGATVAGLAVYHVVAGYYHYRYYVRRRHEPETWKCQPERFLTPALHRRAIFEGSRNLVQGGVITGCLVYGIVDGKLETPIYTDVAEYGWVYTLGMTVVLFVMMDYIDFLVHRTLHVRLLYRHVHRMHHRFVATSPYVTTAGHPLEFLALQAASFAPIFVIPFHAASIAAVLLYILVFNIIDHSGVRLTSILPWQPPSRYHDDHHAHFHVNYGQHLMIWDRMHGTLRRERRRYGQEVFGGRGLPDDGAVATEPAPFVRY